MARDPAVSVLVAVHNGAGYLRPALESVLRQTAEISKWYLQKLGYMLGT